MEVYKRLVASVQAGRGLMLDPPSARTLATMLQQMDQQIGVAMRTAQGCDAALTLYVEEHGSDILDAYVTSLEVIDAIEVPEGEGQDGEVAGLDTSQQEEE